ncbi:MAG: tetratricopeptide repeat protein [Pseudomonadota bacterium]
MHPELLNNSCFLRYYKQWQDDPDSIVFAPIAEYFLTFGMLDDAMKVCREGIKRHPSLVSGKVVMAKIHMRRGNWEEAEENLKDALSIAPENMSAHELLKKINMYLSRDSEADVHDSRNNPAEKTDKKPVAEPPAPSWRTLTMASIYATQGHFDQARAIFKSILTSDPGNEAARRGLEALPASPD